MKPLYHAACVFAGNFITAVAADARELLEAALETPPAAAASHR
jgi:predicted short-subunit dehydrogenase-like oxidoreductase (DUF2520 family)